MTYILFANEEFQDAVGLWCSVIVMSDNESNFYREYSQQWYFSLNTKTIVHISYLQYQGLDTKMIALDVDGTGQVDFLCRSTIGYKLLSWGLDTSNGE